MKLYAGIDLHSNNSYLFIIDEHDQKILSKRLPNDLEVVIQTLEPFKYALTGIVVESTYNWYWLVDGLIANNYTVHLANTTQIQQYNGLKSTNDKTDAFWLAHLLRLDLLAEGYIYPLSERGLRELVRRRCHLVQQQTSNLLSLQGIITRYTGKKISANRIKQLSKDALLDYLQEKHVYTAAKGHLIILNTLLNEICVIEQQILLQMKSNTTFKYLQTIPGIGSILGSVIVLETGSIIRFNNAGCFASYCRCVKSIRSSNNKKKGENNRKNGNKYLSWAFMEAANFAIRHNKVINRYYQRKLTKVHRVSALKAIACKLSKAAFYVMRDEVKFELKLAFSS